jgi:uncharacterized protein
MKINVLEIPDYGLEVDEEERLETDTSDIVKEIKYKLKINKLKDDVFIKGKVDAGLSLQCGRCLKGFEDAISIKLDLAFKPTKSLKGDEKCELSVGELETGFYAENEFDLTEITKEQVMLNTPMKPLCRESCKGICPVCGTDLNEKTCECSKKQADHRFQALEKLLKKGKE